ncbi:hypothetical protein V5799_004242 [Amblyomma americanum]|uniref:Uncharacterized protein n=1 Tax=Amblyomma americanum TaxID=6943 RepID=A0AAQ4D6N8_AMBAM
MIQPQQGYAKRRWTPMQVALKIGLPVLVIAIIIIVVIFAGVSSGKGQGAPPDVANFSLISVDNGSFSLAWQAPESRVDEYWIQVSGSAAGGDDDRGPARRAGPCGNGTLLNRHVTHLTCDSVEPCTNITVTLRVLNFDRSPKVSRGMSLAVFVPGSAPDPPTNLTVNTTSPAVTLVEWEAPAAVSGGPVTYDVKLCDAPGPCDGAIGDCEEFKTPETRLELNSSHASGRCVLVEATTRCSRAVLRSRPAVARITAVHTEVAAR